MRKRWVKASRFCTAPSPYSNTCGLLVLLGRSWSVVDYKDQRWQWSLPQAATDVGLVAERSGNHDVAAERCAAISRKSSAAEVCGQI